MSRFRAAVVVLVVMASALVTPISARAEGLGLLDRDLVGLDGSGVSYSRTSRSSEVVSATVSATNQLVLTTSDSAAPTVTLTIGDGTRPQPGTFYVLNSTTKNQLAGVCPASGSGHVMVDRVTYSGDAVTELSATYGFSCTKSGWASGAIRVGLSRPYAVVRPQPASVGRVPAGRESVTAVPFANTGTASTGTLEPATVGTNVVGVTDFRVVSDGCGGVTLAPGEACTVEVGFTRATSGTSISLVKLRDATFPGRQLVTGITGTAVVPPSAPYHPRTFAVRGGQGVAWPSAYTEVDSYRVLKAAGAGWVEASGPLPSTARTWVDTSLAPGQSATYEVIATNLAGDGPASAAVTGTRPPVDATIGPLSTLTLDLQQKDPTSWADPVRKVGRDVVITMGFDPTSNDYQTLSSPEVQASFPALLPGPGHYDVTQVSGRLDELRVSDVNICAGAPSVLDVDAVSYTPTGTLETLTAHYRIDCGTSTAVGHINYHSPSEVAALTVTPNRTYLPEVHVGDSSATAQVDVTNLAGLPVSLGQRTLTGPAASDWTIKSDSCGDELPVGGTCSVEVHAVPTHGGDRDVQLSFTDSTLRGTHSAHLQLHAIGLPSEPTVVKAVRLPFGGVDLTWSAPSDPGGLGATHWFVRRQANGTETSFTVDPSTFFTDPSAPTGATYTVSMENSLGEGPQSAPVAPSSAVDVLAVKDQLTYNGPTPKLAGLAVTGGLQAVPWTVPGVPDQIVTAEASPNGRSIATVRFGATGGYEIWRHPIDNSTAPVKVWSTPARVVDLAWSPDASRIAVWTNGTTDCCAPTTYVIDAATGKAVTSTPGVSGTAWLPDSRTLVGTDDNANQVLVKLDATTGKRLGPVAGSPHGIWPTVSPDGRWLTYNTGPYRHITISPLGGGTAREVPELAYAEVPQWAPDSKSFILTSAPSSLHGSIYRVPVNDAGVLPAPALQELLLGSNPVPIAWVGRRVAINPMPALNGPVATVPIDFSTFPAGTSLSCAVDSGAFTPCTTTWKTPALSGGSHMVRVRTVEPGGRITVAARSITVDAAAPVTTTTAMPLALLATATSLRFSAADTGGGTVASYDVRYRYAATGGSFTALSQPAAWQGVGSSLALTLAKGYSYCFAVRAKDAVGNLGAWTAETCTHVALDDRSLTATAWTRGASASYYLGTYTTTSSTGRVMSVKASARQVGLVVTTCSTCGTLDVRLGGVYLGRKSLATSTTRVKQLLWLPLGSTRTGTLTLTTVGVKRVYVDGVVLRH